MPNLVLQAMQEISCETANPEALTRALSQLRQSLKIRQGVILGLPSASAIIASIAPLLPNPRRAMLGVQFELQQHLPFELQDAAWHSHWLLSPHGQAIGRAGRVGSAGAAAHAVAVAAVMRRSMLEQRLACCVQAGLSVEAVVITPVAILNAWFAMQPRLVPTLRENHLKPDTVGDHRTDGAGPCLLFHLLDELAGEWILWTSTSVRVIPIHSASPEEFQHEVLASFRTLRGHQDSAVDALHVVGSSGTWPRVRQALVSQEQIEVVSFEPPPSLIGHASSVSPEQPAGMAAIGLALQGLRLARLPLNLLTATQQERRVSAIRAGALAMSGVCLILSLVLGAQGMMELRRRRQHALELAEHRQRLYHTLRPHVRALLQHQEHAQERLQRLQQLLVEAGLLPRLFAQISQALPDDVWLTTLECAKSPLVGVASAAEGIEVSLEGRAVSFQALTQFMDRLKTMTDMTTVKPLSTSVTTDPLNGKEAVLFSVQAQKVPTVPRNSPAADADVSAPPPGRKTRSRRP